MATSNFPSNQIDVSVAIPSGATPSSGVINLDGCSMIGLEFPTMVGTTVSFLKEMADGSFKELKDSSGATRTVTVPTGGGAVSFDNLAPYIGLRRFKIKSTGTETAAVTVIINTRPL